jgi:hypothetical protein
MGEKGKKGKKGKKRRKKSNGINTSPAYFTKVIILGNEFEGIYNF